jgi:nucleoside-diphosphate-sugar epimerase
MAADPGGNAHPRQDRYRHLVRNEAAWGCFGRPGFRSSDRQDPTSTSVALVIAEAAPRRILVSGGTSLIGRHLLPRLEALPNCIIRAISRRPAVSQSNGKLKWLQISTKGSLMAQALASCDVLVHCAPLWLLPEWLESDQMNDLRRVVAFGSTSRFSKECSADPGERSIAKALTDAEERLEDLASRRGFRLTIFRPTLIYGDGLDKNISVIARFIERFGFFPLLGNGDGRRMPVHAADLADACLRVLDNPTTFGRSYNLSGAQAISYREMVVRIFIGLDRTPKLVSLPPGVLRVAIRALRLLPAVRHLTPEMANRMATNLVFDHTEAADDFGYCPRDFHPSRSDLVASS